tara:strand:- start:759 stop:968 length:210 start_codon:yes stop_codon:yes gene_type:complete
MASFIPLYFLNAGDNNFLKPFTTFVQNTSPGLLVLRSVVFRLGVVFLPARFLVVVFFFALGILFSLCFI